MVAKKNSTDLDFVRMYYLHQYDRVEKNESQRQTITNLVLSLSGLAFAFGFKDFVQPTIITGIALPLLIIGANLFALLYIDRSVEFIDTHRKRAHEILLRYAPELREIDEQHKFKAGLQNSRKRIEKGIHQLLILISLIPLGLYIYQTIL
jgi:hypothetical protein